MLIQTANTHSTFTTFQHFNLRWTFNGEKKLYRYRKEKLKVVWVVYLLLHMDTTALIYKNIFCPPGTHQNQITITVNVRWRFGRQTSDQVDHSFRALRWQVWWLHSGLSIKLTPSIFGFHTESLKTVKSPKRCIKTINWLIDPFLQIKNLNY